MRRGDEGAEGKGTPTPMGEGPGGWREEGVRNGRQQRQGTAGVGRERQQRTGMRTDKKGCEGKAGRNRSGNEREGLGMQGK